MRNVKSLEFKNILKSITYVVCSTLVLFLTACSSSEQSENLLSKIGDSTCVSAVPFSFDGAIVTFSVPSEALSFQVSRDGVSIFNTSDKSVTQKQDKGLIPGQTYRYHCEVLLDQDIGYQRVGKELVVTLPADGAPEFSGVKSVSLIDSTSARVTWSLTTGAIISHYKIYKYLGVAASVADFPVTPLAQVNDILSVSKIIGSLGDELTYSFRVTACNSADICDDNDVIATITMPDTGAPTTAGASLIAQVDGDVILTAPWTDSNGYVAKRTIYRATAALGANCPNNFANYAELNNVPVADPRNTPLTITASGVLNEGSRYCFIVRDTDPQGNETTNTVVKFVDIADITSPDFTSVINLVRDGGAPETTLTASWTAMARQIDEPLAGASHYDVYISSVDQDSNPDADPCVTGTLVETLASDAFVQGSNVEVSLSGLTSRDKHRVCVRARDTHDNLSTQKPVALLSTGDVTAPTFAGIQSAAFNGGLERIDVSFVVPQDVDIRNYKITTIRTRDSVENAPIVITKVLGALAAGSNQTTSFTLAEASLVDNDSVSIRIDACDDANPSFNNVDNCSVTVASESITLPDVTPPQNFTGVASAVTGSVHRSLLVSWNLPVDKSDFAGFSVFFVDDSDELVSLNSTACVCTDNDCDANPKTSCEVDRRADGTFLLPSKEYEVFVTAYDVAGNTTSYLTHTGGSKVTALGTTADLVAPSFNASMALSFDEGAKILFTAATDDQDPGLDLEYELYRKTGSTFTCPLTPNTGDGGCDNLTPETVVLGSALATEAGKLKIVDATVTDGNTYFYQLCALDDADNRTCQVGAVGELAIADVTVPEITNASSDKTFGGGGAWTVSFDVSDNISAEDDLVINVYKDASAFPDQNNPGVATFSKAAATVSLAGSTASFDDSGTPDIESVFYLIEVKDESNNSTFLQIRDMPPAPVITSAIWPDPLKVDGRPFLPPSGRFVPANQFVTITGTNLDQIATINDPASNPGSNHGRACITENIVSQTATEIICNFSTGPFYIDIDLKIQDKQNRPVQTINLGFPPRYCDYAAANGITEMQGLGTEAEPYVLCLPDHIKLIGRNADNPNNSEDIIGYFFLDSDIDFTGVTDFTGIPVMDADDFKMKSWSTGATTRHKIKNLTIDTSSTNADAAFLKGCTGSSAETDSIFSGIGFDNVTVKTGSGRAAIVVLDKSCTLPDNADVLIGVSVSNSLIESNNTAGFISAEYASSGDGVDQILVEDSILKSTRPDDTTAVGGMFGKYTGSTATNLIDDVDIDLVDFLPADGQTNSGFNIGGLIGELIGSEVSITGGATTAQIDIHGGRDNIGGVIGHIKGPVNNINIATRATLINILSNGAVAVKKAGEYIGAISYDGVTPSDNITIPSYYTQVNQTNGESHLGGLIGLVDHVDNLDITSGSRAFRRFSDVNGTGDYIGGVIGELKDSNNFTLDGVQSKDGTDVDGANFVGGVIGQITGGSGFTLTNIILHHDVDITATGSDVGGFIGKINGASAVSIQESALGIVKVEGVSRVGGFVGNAYQAAEFTLLNNYINPNEGNAAVAGDSEVGGLIGVLDYDGVAVSETVIQQNGNFGLVTATTATNVGAMIGQYLPAVDPGDIEFLNNYYQNDFVDAGAVTTNAALTAVGEIEGKTLVELQNPATYVNWDVDGVGSLWETSEVGENTAALKSIDGTGLGL